MFLSGDISKALSMLLKGFNHLKSLENQDAAQRLAECAFSIASWGTEDDCKKVLSKINDLSEKTKVQVKEITTYCLVSKLAGKGWTDDDIAKHLASNPNYNFVDIVPKSLLYSLLAIASFNQYDHLLDVFIAEGRETIGSLTRDEIMVYLGKWCKFLERLGKMYPVDKCWALWARGCVLRRQGTVKGALMKIVAGIEEAQRISSRTCLAALWLERGLCEQSLEGEGGKVLFRKMSTRTIRLGAVVPDGPKKEGSDCLKCYNLAIEIAREHGLGAIEAKAQKKLDDKDKLLKYYSNTNLGGVGELRISCGGNGNGGGQRRSCASVHGSTAREAGDRNNLNNSNNNKNLRLSQTLANAGKQGDGRRRSVRQAQVGGVENGRKSSIRFEV